MIEPNGKRLCYAPADVNPVADGPVQLKDVYLDLLEAEIQVASSTPRERGRQPQLGGADRRARLIP